MSKKKIFLLAGGTATAWHLCNLIKNNFIDDFILYVGDMYNKDLIPASLLSDKYFQLPPIKESVYYNYMLNLLEEEKIDIIVPLIDTDLVLFPNDNPDLLKLNIISTAPNTNVMNICQSKSKISKLLGNNGIMIPKLYNQKDIDPEKHYFVKPDSGFGSSGAAALRGKDIDFSKEIIVQEVLQHPEITIEVFCKDDFLTYIFRERLEVKAGVCTKARFYYDEELEDTIHRINTLLPFPLASCIQFMKNSDNNWCLTDLNMRLGAGTALSSAAGFGLAAAFLSTLSGKNDYKNYFEKINDNQIVVRVYNEIIMPCRN